MTRVLLALGSNRGDRCQMLARATHEVALLPQTQLLARSQWHETAPIGGPSGQGPFLNGCLLLETQLAPDELSTAAHDIERRLGRKHAVRWDAREIDIDLLLYGRQVRSTAELTIPHPRMSFRRFVLEPACEIAPWLLHPECGWTLAQLLRHLDASPRRVSITAADSDSARRLTEAIAEDLGTAPPELRRQSPPAGPDLPEPTAVELSVHAEGGIRSALRIIWELPGGEAPAEMPDRRGLGPVARIEGDDFSAVLAEAVAAVRAAWPDAVAAMPGRLKGTRER